MALVLDNTGSMADSGKMPALQAATKSLLTQLQGAVTVNGDVYVSIIPFVKDVNLGAANWNSNWIYWGTQAQDTALSDNNSWDANNGTCSTGNYSTRSSCVSHSSCSISGYNSQSSCTGAGTCSISGNNSQSSCTGAGTCSISGRTTQSSCTTGTCSISGYSTQSTCTGAGTCSISGNNEPEQLHRRGRLFKIEVHDEQHLLAAQRNMDYRCLDRWRLGAPWDLDGRGVDARRVERGHLDAQQPQHLEWLRHGPRAFDHA